SGGGDSAGAGDAAGEVIGAEQRRSTGFGEESAEDIPLLGHEELAFEILNLLELRASGSGRCLLMRQGGGSGLRLEGALAAVGHEGVASGQGDVLQVGGDARATVDGDGSGLLVATGWVAHNVDAEIRLEELARGGYGRPREGDAEQAAFEQEGVRLFFVLREVRAVGAVDGGEEGVFAIGVSPAEANEIERKAHGAGGLVTGDARAPVGAEWGEEGVILRLDFAGLIQEAKLAGGVFPVLRGRERDAAGGIPPRAGALVTGFQDAAEVDYCARLLLLCGQQSGGQHQNGRRRDNRERAGRVHFIDGCALSGLHSLRSSELQDTVQIFCAAFAARKLSGVNGICRIRTPVAS